MISTKAAIVEQPGAPFTVRDVTLDEPRANEVLVRMVAAGLCHTDLGAQVGAIPFKLPGILGHEGAGIVERVGTSVTKVSPGDKVLLSFTSCGHCAPCRDGHPAYCTTWMLRNLINGTRDDGSSTVHYGDTPLGGHFFGQSSFAVHALADERSVVRVDDDADLEMLAPLGCGVMTGVGAVWNILQLRPGSTLAIFGSGAVGLSAVMAANLLPLKTIIAIDRVPERLALAVELGATHTINVATDDTKAMLLEITGQRGLDGTIETTGNTSVLRTAVDLLASRGRCAVVGVPHAGTEVSLDVVGLLGGKQVIGVTQGDAEPDTLLPQLVELYKRGRLPLNKLVKHYSLEEINRAAEDMHHGKTVKPVVLFNSH